MPCKTGPFLVNEFLPVGHFLKSAINKLPLERHVKIRDEVTKGSSIGVLQKMIKHFSLSDVYYPIDTSPANPVLLISEHVNMDQTELLEKFVERKLAQQNFLRRLKADILLMTKEDEPYICLRHQNVPEPDGKIGSL